ncbi:MAG: HD domain-containing phosphohydrolase [Gammaproteobacteria bacterium]
MTAIPAQILFVDDERPILNSLKRLLRPTGHRVHIANSGAEALSILNENAVDVVVSDMRMPEMDGAEFLANVARQWPDTTRMLLTGYADLTSAVDAINNGAISRYLTKPWQDTDIVMCLEQAIQNLRLTREKSRLEKLNAKQNHELKLLNDSLEEKVARRTEQIEAAKKQLASAHEELQSSFSATIEIFSSLINSRAGIGCRVSVARDARAVARAMGLPQDECQALYDAGLLCDIGKISLPDAAVNTPYVRLDAASQRLYQRHPINSEAVLVSLQPLAAAARTIRLHCERVDGTGFPDKIAGNDIPLPAKILAVCKSYADLQDGRFFPERHTAEDARAYIKEQKGERYDPEVVDQFCLWLDNPKRRADEVVERKITLSLLAAGMKTTRDLFDPNGMLVLAKDQTVSDALIERLVRLQKSLDESLTIYVEA